MILLLLDSLKHSIDNITPATNTLMIKKIVFQTLFKSKIQIPIELEIVFRRF